MRNHEQTRKKTAEQKKKKQGRKQNATVLDKQIPPSLLNM